MRCFVILYALLLFCLLAPLGASMTIEAAELQRAQIQEALDHASHCMPKGTHDAQAQWTQARDAYNAGLRQALLFTILRRKRCA